MLSDMNKHEDTKGVLAGPIGQIGLMEAVNANPESARRFIEGFN